MAPVASAPGEAEPLGPAEGQPGQGTGWHMPQVTSRGFGTLPGAMVRRSKRRQSFGEVPGQASQRKTGTIADLAALLEARKALRASMMQASQDDDDLQGPAAEATARALLFDGALASRPRPNCCVPEVQPGCGGGSRQSASAEKA